MRAEERLNQGPNPLIRSDLHGSNVDTMRASEIRYLGDSAQILSMQADVAREGDGQQTPAYIICELSSQRARRQPPWAFSGENEYISDNTGIYVHCRNSHS